MNTTLNMELLIIYKKNIFYSFDIFIVTKIINDFLEYNLI
jgi:hypothetical protein